MGGGGGTGFFGGSTSPEELSRLVKDSQAQVKDAAYESGVSGLLDRLLADYNDRDREATRTHLATIRQAINREIEGTVDVIFGGSVAKHTYVDGLSDIDALVVLNRSELRSMSPEQVKEYFVRTLRERLPGSRIEEGRLAVTVSFADGQTVQLLPALRQGGRVGVSDPSGQRWLSTQPQRFAEDMKRLNQRCSGKLVPTIKLAKAIIGNLPEQHRLTGYHVEALAVEAFRNYRGSVTTKAMLRHFFERASEAVSTPIREPAGQSAYVDEYLGGPRSAQRQSAADALGRISRRMRNADAGHLTDAWQELFE